MNSGCNPDEFEKIDLEGGVLYYCDSRKIKKVLKGTSVDFVVTSPPYWKIRDYSFKNQIGFGQSYKEYIQDLKLVFDGCHKTLKEGRWMAVNIGTVVSDKGMKFIAGDIVDICEDIGFTFRKDIIWHKPRGQTKWQRGATQFAKSPYPRHYNTNINHEFVLLFSKGQVSRNWEGESQEIFTEFVKYTRSYVRQVAYSVWDIPPVNSPRLDEKHAAPFPEELPQRLIELFTYPGETVLDPFSGAGTALRAAKKLGRKFVGVDFNRNYIKYSRKRLEEIPLPDIKKVCFQSSHRFDILPRQKLENLMKKKKELEKEILKLKKELTDGSASSLQCFFDPQ